MRRKHKEQEELDKRTKYPTFLWTEHDIDDYYFIIEETNESYREMLTIGKFHNTFRMAKEDGKSMLNTKDKPEFIAARSNI